MDGISTYCKKCDKEKRDKRYYQKWNDAQISTLSNAYIISKLKAKGFENIDPQLIEIQRQLLTLKRNIHELQRDNRKPCRSK